MKVYKEVWKDGKLVVGEQTDAAPTMLPIPVQQLLTANGIAGHAPPRPKLFNRPDAVSTTDLAPR